MGRRVNSLCLCRSVLLQIVIDADIQNEDEEVQKTSGTVCFSIGLEHVGCDTGEVYEDV